MSCVLDDGVYRSCRTAGIGDSKTKASICGSMLTPCELSANTIQARAIRIQHPRIPFSTIPFALRCHYVAQTSVCAAQMNDRKPKTTQVETCATEITATTTNTRCHSESVSGPRNLSVRLSAAVAVSI